MVQTGDLVFVRGSGFISRAIEDITHSAYSHVALAVQSDKLIEANGKEPVEIVPVTKYNGHADVFRSALPLETLQRIVENAKAHEGEKYGYKLIFEEFVRDETGVQLPFHEDEHPICSVLIVDAIRKERVAVCQGIQYPDPGDMAKDGLYKYLSSY